MKIQNYSNIGDNNKGCTEADCLYSSSASAPQALILTLWSILVATWPPPTALQSTRSTPTPHLGPVQE